MKLTRFIPSEDGGSVFEEFEIVLDGEREGAGGYTLMTSTTFNANNICFVNLPAGLDQDWHQAPARQLVQVLSGEVEVTTSDGQTRQWRAGELFMAADVTGKGHKTRVLGGDATVIFIPLPDGVFV